MKPEAVRRLTRNFGPLALKVYKTEGRNADLPELKKEEVVKLVGELAQADGLRGWRRPGNWGGPGTWCTYRRSQYERYSL